MVKNAETYGQEESWEPPDSWIPANGVGYQHLRQGMEKVLAQRSEIKSPRTGNVVQVRAPSSVSLPASPDFDLFHRAAAIFLRDLLPGSRVVLTYQSETDPENPPLTLGPGLVENPSCLLSRVSQSVGDGMWFRTFDVWVEPIAQEFLQNLPPEFEYLHAHALDYAHIAIRSLANKSAPEVKENVKAELSLTTVADMVTAQLLPNTYPHQKAYRHFAATLRDTIRNLQALAATRVEHSLLSHGVVVSPKLRLSNRASHDPYPACFSKLKRSALLSDGHSAVLILDRDGFPVRLFSPPNKSYIGLYDLPELRTLLSASRLFGGAGLLLRKDGSIIVTIRGEPLLVNRSGIWRSLLWRGFREGLRREIGEGLGDLIAAVALQHSLKGTGCILGIMEEADAQSMTIGNQNKVDTARATAPRQDEPAAWLWHRLLPTQSAKTLGVNLLWCLSAIDGATLISPSDKLLAYGVIVETEPAIAEGARTAAARCLSRKGRVVKVSADGPISVWRCGRQVIEI